MPLFNEERVVPEFLRRLRKVLDGLSGGPHEMVFVDDGSTDRSFEILREAASSDPRLIAISLSRNFGHQSALSAALDQATGDLVVVMDGDLQDPPEAIPLLLAEQEKGYDVVYAKRSGRKEAWPLRLCYFLFYRLIAYVANIQLPRDAGDFAVLTRRVVDRLKSLPERHRYLRGLRAWVGFRQTGVAVERSERYAGASKYGFWKLWRLALDGIFAFSMAPLRAAALLGFVTISGTLLYVAYAIYAKIFLHQSPPGFTALLVAMTLFAGIQLLFLGVIGEYIGRIYEETKGRPHYIVREVAGRAGGPAPQSTERA
ncbi:MAG: glycosyltransferase family 2 protein [Thermoanaerobaculia bacterium]